MNRILALSPLRALVIATMNRVARAAGSTIGGLQRSGGADDVRRDEIAAQWSAGRVVC